MPHPAHAAPGTGVQKAQSKFSLAVKVGPPA
jgi:hypothetical protein